MRTSLCVLTLLSALTTGCLPKIDPPACLPDGGAPAADMALPGPITLIPPPGSCAFLTVASGGTPPLLQLGAASFPKMALTATPAQCAGTTTGSSSVKLECTLTKDQFAAFKDVGANQPYRIDIRHKYWLPLFPVSAQSITAAASVGLKQRAGTSDAAQIKYSVPVNPYAMPPMSSEPTVSSTERLLWKPPAPLANDDLTLTFEASFVCGATGTTLQRGIEWEVAGITLTPVLESAYQ